MASIVLAVPQEQKISRPIFVFLASRYEVALDCCEPCLLVE